MRVTCFNCGHPQPHTTRRGECLICGCDAPDSAPTNPDNVDNRVDQWHEGAGKGQELYEYLGWTRAEYAAWVERNEFPADNGHTFRIAVTSRMSSSVVGDKHHKDADHFGPPLTLDVRAWDLPAALRLAIDTPLSEWTHEDD